MKRETINKLLEEYRSLAYKNSNTALKYVFQYNGVNINIYYDAYDEDVVSLSMVLSKDHDYYYSSLNIIKNDRNTEYLYNIPFNILESLLDDNYELKSFFDIVDDHLLNDRYICINYKNDIYFVNTLKYAQIRSKRKDLPFLKGIRHSRMQDETLFNLYETLCIPKDVLKKLQENGLTLVRTDNANQRKRISIILKESGIDFKL